MPGIEVFLILLTLIKISPIICLTLSPGDKKVKFEDNRDGYYTITLDENLKDLVLFKIENAGGDINVDFSSACTDIMYGSKYDNKEFRLTKPLDYEKSGCPDTKHTVRDSKSGDPVTFELKLNNLDDNPPQFELGSHCQLHENKVYTQENATCTLTMTDLDGMINGTILSIQDNENAAIFKVSFKEEPKETDKTTSVVIYLQDGKTLDYETKYSYVFVVRAEKSVQSGEVQVVIDVVDEPDTPPKFTKMFTTQQFEENLDQKFNVLAHDGDIGINSSISYSITKNGCSDHRCAITISKDKGEINVINVDREETGDTILLTIEATEEDDGSSTPLDITFFIIDQDDNIPDIKANSSEISIDEGTRGTILKFSVEDMDLSDNGTFSIELNNGESSVDYKKAFEVIPDSGYQIADFTVTIVNSTALDYEDVDWKVIKFYISAIERANKTHKTTQSITINLKDINDEPPIFVNTSNDVFIREDIKAGAIIFNAIAIDRDEGDKVSYKIVGVWSQKLDISDEGLITTRNENTFDYESLQQVIIAIKATDNNVTHTTLKTLTINVLDVDDEPPVMTVNITSDNKMVKIPENSIAGTTLDDVTIIVTDPDTEPKLKLEIDWQSSYVTKNSGIKKLGDEVWQCFEVDTSSKENQTIERKISINDRCSPDFEKFDAIVLFLKATDENTVIGQNSTKGSTLINIGDLNDNSPQFINSSLEYLTVTDGTNTITKIGIISAKDDDIDDILSFSIKPASEKEPDWVTINETSGQLTVKTGVTIDCDEPKRDNVVYSITVTDSEHYTTQEVSIGIIDINDEVPHIKATKTEVEIMEKSNDNTVVSVIDSEDADRDVPFNTVVFKFETNLTNEVSNRFDISESGHITVKLRNGASLDRDNGPTSYTLPILAYDNPTGTLQLKDHFDLKVKLLDLDDNIPILLNKSLSSTENLKMDDVLGDVVAYDPDEDGPNSDVSFDLKKIDPIGDHSKNELTKDFFEITKSGQKTATIKILKSLRDYWGEFNLTIRTNDAGKTNLFNDNNITLTVEKFNFEQPIFEFPSTDDDRAVVVRKDRTKANSEMILYNGEKLKHLNVDDRQNHKWDVAYEITEENGGPADLFKIVQFNNWEGSLQLQRSLSEEEFKKNYTITITAKVKNDMKEGEAQVSVETQMTINFFSSSEQPKFNKIKFSCDIKENTNETISIPQASFIVKNLKPYYFIGDPSDTFKINPEDGTIILRELLDYEMQNEFSIRIVALNENIPPIDPPVDGDNVLHVTVKVIDLNDHEPVFTPSKFTGAFLRNYKEGTTILTVKAVDADPTLQVLKFSLQNFDCSESLKAPEVPFEIGKSDGKITNDFTVTSDMSGYCNFLVVVEDESYRDEKVHTVNTTVQINVISDDELVKFTFFNTDGFINENLDEVTSIIDEAFKEYNYKSYLADLSYDDNFKNTTAHFFFMDSNEVPVPAVEILGNLSDPNQYAALTKTLAAVQVQLYYFSYDNVPETVNDYLKIWLIVTIFVLASLLTMTSIVFFFRNRALTKRLTNLSTTKFGSQESGLNRAGVTAPTTNKNAIEGSNPVFNSESFIKEMEDDRISVLSGDSDLLGVENNPDFDI